MKKRSGISVIIPTRDYGSFIAESIESVLDQTLLPEEIIVVDDGSTDDTAGIVKKYSSDVKYVFLSGKGVGSARNLGIELSSCEYIAHLDADDVWIPEKLEVQMEEFMKDPALDIVGGMMQPFYDPGMDKKKREKVFCSETPIPGFSASVILLKRGSFVKVGPYRNNVKVGQDLDWFIRVREVPLKELMVNRLLAYRRLHNFNSSVKVPGNSVERLRILKESLDRKRKK